MQHNRPHSQCKQIQHTPLLCWITESFWRNLVSCINELRAALMAKPVTASNACIQIMKVKKNLDWEEPNRCLSPPLLCINYTNSFREILCTSSYIHKERGNIPLYLQRDRERKRKPIDLVDDCLTACHNKLRNTFMIYYNGRHWT